MKRYIVAAASMLIAASAVADDIHGEFAKGNPDVKPHVEAAGEAGSGAGTVTKADVYKDIAEENPDLRGKVEATTPETESPDIYKKIEPNPDLNY